MKPEELEEKIELEKKNNELNKQNNELKQTLYAENRIVKAIESFKPNVTTNHEVKQLGELNALVERFEKLQNECLKNTNQAETQKTPDKIIFVGIFLILIACMLYISPFVYKKAITANQYDWLQNYTQNMKKACPITHKENIAKLGNFPK